MLRANELIWNYWVSNYLMGETPSAFDVLYWNGDGTGMTAQYNNDFSEFVENNPLVTAGAMKVRGTPIADIADLDIDSYVLGAKKDHLCVWQGVYRSAQMLGDRSQFVLGNSGHVQTIVCPPGNPKASFSTNEDLSDTAEEWMKGATRHSGSWWDHGVAWTAEHAGSDIAGAERRRAMKSIRCSAPHREPMYMNVAREAMTRDDAATTRPKTSTGPMRDSPDRDYRLKCARGHLAGQPQEASAADVQRHRLQPRTVGAVRRCIGRHRNHRVRCARHRRVVACLVPYRLWMLAMLTSRLLNKLGYDKVDVLGVSWGGAIAQQFALQNPKRCRRLVLAATAQGFLMMPGKLSVLAKFITPRRFNDPDYRACNAGEIYGGAARRNPSLIQEFRKTSKTRLSDAAVGSMGWTSVPWLPLLRQPTLVMAGDDDPVIPLVNAKLMAGLIRNSRLHVFHDGHLFLISNAVEAGRVVRDFLAGPEEEIDMKKLEGKIALVSGSGRGIGREIALKLASDGARIVVNDLDTKFAEETVAAIRGARIRCGGLRRQRHRRGFR